VYFVVAEALTNVTRHSGADRAEVTVHSDGNRVRVDVRDDGRGGADEARGTGLAGLRRRVAAFDGHLSLTSPAGGPTVLHVELPCAS
jgi:signal transduction histidine kinase